MLRCILYKNLYYCMYLPMQILTQSVNIGLLSIEGARCPVRPPPQQLSLPPIEEQRNPSLVTSKTNWPITNRMLKSVV